MTREEKVQELLARYVEAQMVDGVSLWKKRTPKGSSIET